MRIGSKIKTLYNINLRNNLEMSRSEIRISPEKSHKRNFGTNPGRTVKGMSRKVASAIKDKYDGPEARTYSSKVIQLGWAALSFDNPEYPQSLLSTHDAPPLLFRSGDATPQDEKMIADAMLSLLI